MFAPEFSMLITSASAMLALVGASGIGYAAGKRRTRLPARVVPVAAVVPPRSAVSASPAAVPAPTPAVDTAPAELSPEQVARKRRIEQRAAEARMLAGPAVAAPVEGVELLGPRRPRVINDHLAIERFLKFMRDCGARTLPAEDADDIATSSADDGSLAIMAALIADPLLAVDWMTTEELAEIYVAWCRVKGYVPMAEGALLPEIVHVAGVTRDRRRLKGAAFVRIRDRYAQRGINKERATIVRVWSAEEMAARDRQRAGEARRDRVSTAERWAPTAARAA